MGIIYKIDLKKKQKSNSKSMSLNEFIQKYNFKHLNSIDNNNYCITISCYNENSNNVKDFDFDVSSEYKQMLIESIKSNIENRQENTFYIFASTDDSVKLNFFTKKLRFGQFDSLILLNCIKDREIKILDFNERKYLFYKKDNSFMLDKNAIRIIKIIMKIISFALIKKFSNVPIENGIYNILFNEMFDIIFDSNKEYIQNMINSLLEKFESICHIVRKDFYEVLLQIYSLKESDINNNQEKMNSIFKKLFI